MQGLVDVFKPLYDLWLTFEAFMVGPASPGLLGYWIVIALMMTGFYIVRIRNAYDTIEDDEILAVEEEEDR